MRNSEPRRVAGRYARRVELYPRGAVQRRSVPQANPGATPFQLPCRLPGTYVTACWPNPVSGWPTIRPLSAGAPFQRVGRFFFASHCERKWFDWTDSIAMRSCFVGNWSCLQGANPWTIHCHAELLRILPGTTLRQSPNWSMTPLSAGLPLSDLAT